jgi:hypothetical protein
VLFGLAARIFFGPTSLSFIGQPLRFLGGADACLLTNLDPLDLLFDGAEPRFRPAPHFIFLRALSAIRLEIAAFLLGPAARLFFLSLSQL